MQAKFSSQVFCNSDLVSHKLNNRLCYRFSSKQVWRCNFIFIFYLFFIALRKIGSVDLVFSGGRFWITNVHFISAGFSLVVLHIKLLITTTARTSIVLESRRADLKLRASFSLGRISQPDQSFTLGMAFFLALLF